MQKKYLLDFSSNIIQDPKNPLKSWQENYNTLNNMRLDINSNQRKGGLTYELILDNDVGFYDVKMKKKMMIQQGDTLIVNLNRKSLYPVGYTENQLKKPKQPYNITLLKQDGENVTLSLQQKNYVPDYQLTDILGILVAQQLRFNTFELNKPQKSKPIIGTRNYFNKLKNYLQSYQNWQSRNDLQHDVKILVDYLP